MSNATKSIIEHVPGLYQQAHSTLGGYPLVLRAAPIVNQNSQTGEFQIRKATNLYDKRNPIVKTANGAGFIDTPFEYSKVNFDIPRVAGPRIALAARDIISLRGGNPDLNPVSDAVEECLDHFYAGYTAMWTDEVSTALSDGDTLDISTASAESDLLDYFQTQIETIVKTRGPRYAPNVYVIGMSDFHKLARNDAFAQGVAVSSTETGTRRLGSNDPNFVAQWFQTRFATPIELVVVPDVVVGLDGSNAFSMVSKSFLVHSGEGNRPSCLKTLVQTTGRDASASTAPGTSGEGQLVDLQVLEADARHGYDAGTMIVAGSGAFKIQVMDSSLGLELPITNS